MKLNQNPSATITNMMLNDNIDIDNLLISATTNSLYPARSIEKGKKNGFLNYRPSRSNLLTVPKRHKLNSKSQQQREAPQSKTQSQSGSKAEADPYASTSSKSKSSSTMSTKSTLSSREEYLQQNGITVFQWAVIFAVVGAGLWYSRFKARVSIATETSSPVKLSECLARGPRTTKKVKNSSKAKAVTSGSKKMKHTQVRNKKSHPVPVTVDVVKQPATDESKDPSDIELDIVTVQSKKKKKKNKAKRNGASKRKNGRVQNPESAPVSEKTSHTERIHSSSSEASAPDSTSTDGSSVFDSDDNGKWQTVGSHKQSRGNALALSGSGPAVVAEATSLHNGKSAFHMENLEYIENTVNKSQDEVTALDDDAALAHMLQEQENIAAFGITKQEEAWEEVTTKKKKKNNDNSDEI